MIMMLSLWSTLVGLLATVSLILWKPKPFTRRRIGYPKISILKPIRGLEPDLEVNLHSFFNLNKTIQFELLFCIKNKDDQAVEVVDRLIALHPDVEAKLFTNTPDLGRNPKVSNIHWAWERASSDLLLISDSNVRVDPNYLEVLHSERRAGAALVTQAVFGADARHIGGHLDVIHLNTFYLKATAFVNLFGFPCVLGKCMLFSRRQFDRLGGLFLVRNYLAEDLVAGEMMKEAGFKVSVAPTLLRQTTVMTNFKSYWNRHVRWARLRKCHFFGAYLLEPLLFETLWPLLLIALATTRTQRNLGAACFAIQLLSNLAIHTIKFKDKSSLHSLSFFWLKDIIAPMIWTAGLISNKVVWRGQTLQLRFGGKLGTKYLRAARIRKISARIRNTVQA
jgi:ceramide glucosyltransferase